MLNMQPFGLRVWFKRMIEASKPKYKVHPLETDEQNPCNIKVSILWEHLFFGFLHHCYFSLCLFFFNFKKELDATWEHLRLFSSWAV